MTARNIEFARQILGEGAVERIENKICPKCGRPAYEHTHTPGGFREIEISGICEECFDKMFGGEDE